MVGESMAKRISIFFTFLILSTAIVAAAAGKVDMKVEMPRQGVGVGDQFRIYITVTDINESPAAPASVPGASVLYFGHRSSSSSFVSTNGRTSQTFTNVYAITLKAEKKGKFNYGPITVGGVKSNAVTYNIGAAGSAAPDPQSAPQGNGIAGMQPDPNSNSPTFIGKGNEQLFLRANVSKTTAYEQEALVYTVKLYTTYNSIKFIGATDSPKFDGFVIEESSDISDQLTIETYQGKSYATAIIARYIIFPQMPGKLKVTGNKYTVSADAEEYYHDPFFSRLTVRRPVQLHVTPNDLTVNVNPLPQPRPSDFSGGVGRFSISSSLPSSQVVANQAGAVTYTVKGEGNLKYINLPDLNNIYPSEIEVFSPNAEVNTRVGANNVSGSVKFDYSFMPMEPGNFDIPAVKLVYFNPSTGKYETVAAKGFMLKVARGKESSKSQAALAFSSRLMTEVGHLSKNHIPLVYQFVYWLWFIIPTLALLVVVFLYRKHLAEQADIVSLKSKRAAKMARKRLRTAGSCMADGRTTQFYDEMLKALWGYLGDKLKLPISELNRANVQGLLEESYVPEPTRDKLLELLDHCEFAKYSPQRADADMKPVYEEGISTLNELEEGFKAGRLKKAEEIKLKEREQKEGIL